MTHLKDNIHLDVCVLGSLIICTHIGHVLCFSNEPEQKDATRKAGNRLKCYLLYTIYKNCSDPDIYRERRKSMHSKAKESAETMKNEEAEDPIK